MAVIDLFHFICKKPLSKKIKAKCDEIFKFVAFGFVSLT
jgi:hypothetical protein